MSNNTNKYLDIREKNNILNKSLNCKKGIS